MSTYTLTAADGNKFPADAAKLIKECKYFTRNDSFEKNDVSMINVEFPLAFSSCAIQMFIMCINNIKHIRALYELDYDIYNEILTLSDYLGCDAIKRRLEIFMRALRFKVVNIFNDIKYTYLNKIADNEECSTKYIDKLTETFNSLYIENEYLYTLIEEYINDSDSATKVIIRLLDDARERDHSYIQNMIAKYEMEYHYEIHLAQYIRKQIVEIVENTKSGKYEETNDQYYSFIIDTFDMLYDLKIVRGFNDIDVIGYIMNRKENDKDDKNDKDEIEFVSMIKSGIMEVIKNKEDSSNEEEDVQSTSQREEESSGE